MFLPQKTGSLITLDFRAVYVAEIHITEVYDDEALPRDPMQICSDIRYLKPFTRDIGMNFKWCHMSDTGDGGSYAVVLMRTSA